MRKKSNENASYSVVAHDSEVNCVDFNPYYEYVMATGSTDKSVKLWDLRYISKPMHELTGHKDEILQVQWSPHDQSVLASASADRRVNVWDLSRVGDELGDEDAADGPPELMVCFIDHFCNILCLIFSSFTEDTLVNCPIYHGILAIHGCWHLLPKITLYKSGKW